MTLRQRSLRTGEAALQIASEVSGDPIKTTFRGMDYSLHPAVVLVQMINHYRLLGFGLKYPDAFAHTHLKRCAKP